MTAETFRRDKFLRASGYNLCTWGAANLVIVLPAYAAARGTPWAGWAGALHSILCIVGASIVCGLNDNRVQKLCGPAAENPVVDAGRIWLPLFAAGTIWTVIFLARGPVAYVQPLWMAVVGVGYLAWGGFTVPEFRWLGAALLAASTISGLTIDPVALERGAPAANTLAIWCLAMGVAWFPIGIYLNRRYVSPRGSSQP